MWRATLDKWGSQTIREFRRFTKAVEWVGQEMSGPRCVVQTSKLVVWWDNDDTLLIMRKVVENKKCSTS